MKTQHKMTSLITQTSFDALSSTTLSCFLQAVTKTTLTFLSKADSICHVIHAFSQTMQMYAVVFLFYMFVRAQFCQLINVD